MITRSATHTRDSDIAEYGSSCFVAFKNQITHSKNFVEYWRNFAIAEYPCKPIEKTLPEYFTGLGYMYDAYCDTSSIDMRYTFNHCECNLITLLREYKYPVINHISLSLPKDYLLHNDNRADETAKAMEYVQQYYSYDLLLIINL